MNGFARYLASLTGSWEALAAPHPDALVVRGEGFVACRHPNPVLDNAVVLDPAAVTSAAAVYADVGTYALWSLDEDVPVCAALEAAGFRRDTTTRPMVCTLDEVVDIPSPPWVELQKDIDPGRIAELNGVPADLLRGVPGALAYATQGDASGLVLIPIDDDVNVSLVATRPQARRRGLATTVTRAALIDARSRGFRTASLQATPMAEPMYAALGFTPVGRWQEWVPRSRGAD